MKRSFIILPVVLLGLYFSLSSNSSGPASAGNGIRNGGPGSNGNCSGCHGGGAGTTTMTIALKEKTSGAAANGKYKPGVVYTVTIGGNNANLAFFGFQLTAATTANLQAGNFTNLGSNKHAVVIGGLQVVEHSQNIAKTSGNYLAEFDWTAPAAGTGTITLYGIINGVNGDNGTNGDKASAPVNLSLTETVPPTAIEDVTTIPDLKIFPNPATDRLYFSSNKMAAGKYQVTVYDRTGRAVIQEQQQISGVRVLVPIVLDRLTAGTYILHINGKEQSVVRSFVKR